MFDLHRGIESVCSLSIVYSMSLPISLLGRVQGDSASMERFPKKMLLFVLELTSGDVEILTLERGFVLFAGRSLF